MAGANAMSMLNRAVSALQQGDMLTAAFLARELAGDKTAISDTLFRGHLADLCLQCELWFDASELYEPMLASSPDDVSLHYKAGTASMKSGNVHLAERHYRRCATLRPDHPASYLQLGHVCRATRDFDQAAENYLRYIAKSKVEKGHGYWSLTDLRSFKFSRKVVAEMRQHLGKCRGNQVETSIMHFAMGNVSEQSKDYTQALRHFRLANNIQKKLHPFSKDAYQNMVDGLIDSRMPDEMASNVADRRPIFIVGLPRSGTTLVEQILAAHSSVVATDELPYMERIAFELERQGGYGARLECLDDTLIKGLRSRYLSDASRHIGSHAGHFVDKNPNNILHVGLIRRLLPEALIIVMQRDLRGNALSMYRQLFVSGHEYSADFSDIHIYSEGCLRLTNHWIQQHPDAIRRQSYQSLVNNPEDEISDLLAHCGLEPEPACFEFYKSQQNVMTPSASQVSQPMYTSAVDFWKNYEVLLADEFKSLASLQDRYASA